MSTDITRGTSVSDERVGTLLADRYRLDAVVGTGGMATVYRATDESLGRRVAIKVFRPDLADADDVRRQREEIRLIASLSHPGVVTLFDAVADDAGDGPGRAFIVMQYVDGPDLRERLSQGALGAATTALVGADLADALAYVHTRGVIHRDLKPANILVPSDASTGPVAMLTDFGIARLVDGTRLTATGSVLGTASYLSPEQAVGAGLSPASDVYSLGLVLIEALTGERCFPGSALESAAARLSADPPVPLEYGEEWASLLRQMTARRPEDRISAGAVAARLRGIALETAEISDPTLRLPVAAADRSGAQQEQHTLAMDAVAPTAAGASLAASEAPTETFTAAPLPAAATVSAAPVAARRRRRRVSPAVIAAAIAGLMVVAAAGIWGAVALQPAATTTPVEYPVVEGDLGTSLEQLQESVAP